MDKATTNKQQILEWIVELIIEEKREENSDCFIDQQAKDFFNSLKEGEYQFDSINLSPDNDTKKPSIEIYYYITESDISTGHEKTIYTFNDIIFNKKFIKPLFGTEPVCSGCGKEPFTERQQGWIDRLEAELEHDWLENHWDIDAEKAKRNLLEAILEIDEQYCRNPDSPRTAARREPKWKRAIRVLTVTKSRISYLKEQLL